MEPGQARVLPLHARNCTTVGHIHCIHRHQECDVHIDTGGLICRRINLGFKGSKLRHIQSICYHTLVFTLLHLAP